jgi:hypothetical protein
MLAFLEMRALLNIIAFLSLLPLASCVGGTLGDTSEFEMLPLRSATQNEAHGLKRCLNAARAAQESHRKKTGHFFRRVKDLPVDNDCGGYRLGQKGTPTGYEINAEIHGDDATVIWSVNEKGVIEEHLDPEGSADLEL